MDGDKSENLKFFTMQELSRHDGSNESLPLLLSVQGMIFDVSESRGFYGPGAFSPLSCFWSHRVAAERIWQFPMHL
jgi:hypothetical protein